MKIRTSWRVIVILILTLNGAVSRKTNSIEEFNEFEKLLSDFMRYQGIDVKDNSVESFLFEHEAKEWLERYNVEYSKYMSQITLAEFIYETNITGENEKFFSEAECKMTVWKAKQASRAEEFANSITVFTDPDVERMLKLILLAKDDSEDEEVNKRISSLRNSMTEIYGTAKPGNEPLSYHENVLARSRDWDEQLDAWRLWRDATGPRIRPYFTEYIEERNKLAVSNGWTDAGEFWRVMDFEEDNVEEITEALYEDILPLYKELHAYVRRKLIDFYPDNFINGTGPIPAHLVGNMWAQSWINIIDLVKPFPDCEEADPTYQLLAQEYTAADMFKLSEEFFTSLSLGGMTDVFWKESMIVRPDDGREVVCHASASDFYRRDDFRIKMCTERTADDLFTIHHEMGHIEYFMQYAHQPALYRKGANAAFHEAIGDTIALSVMTPEHMSTVHLLNESYSSNTPCSNGHPSEADLNFLMMVALEKIAFLPYGYLLDKYRWEIFRGNIDNTNYNTVWWQMREEIQGIMAPVARSEDDFDPGAKYHVAAQVPYIRYFLAHIGQFQFLKAMCDVSGHQGPLYKCDVYRSLPAGNLLKSMLKLGSSRPWPEAMEVMTGQRHFKSNALFEYFQPLYNWLKDQNKKEHKGW